MTRVEIAYVDRAIWQSDTAKTYQCPICLQPLFTTYEGDDLPTIYCDGPLTAHRLEWSDPSERLAGRLARRKIPRKTQ